MRPAMALAALACALAAGCSVAAEAPPRPFPEPGGRWERSRWEAVEIALELREEGSVPSGTARPLAVASAVRRWSESGRYTLGAGRAVLVNLPAGSRLRVDARELPPALAARLRVGEIEAPGPLLALAEGGAGAGIARVPRSDAHAAGGVIEVPGPAEGCAAIVVSLAAPETETAEVVLERLRLAPVEYRWEGLEERAKRFFAGDEKVAASLPTASAEPRLRGAFAERIATVLPWDAPAAPSGTALGRAERAILLATWFTEVLAEREDDPALFFRERGISAQNDGSRAVAVEGEPLADYAVADRGRPLELEAEGPSLLLLETRVPYDVPAAGPLLFREDVGARRYALRVLRRSAETPGARFSRAADLFFASAVDDLDGLRHDALGRPVTRRRTQAVLVPPGRHALRIEAAEPVLVRMRLRTKKVNWRDAIDGSEDAGAYLAAARAAADQALGEGGARDRARAAYIRAACELLAGRDDAALERLAAIPVVGDDALWRGVDLAAARWFYRRDEIPLALAATESAAAGRTDLLARAARRLRAEILMADGKAALAAAEYRALAALAPQDASLEEGLGRALLWVPWTEGAEPAAVAALDRALALAPGDGRLRELRETARLHFSYLQPISPAERLGAAAEAFAEELWVPEDEPPRPGSAAAAILAPDEGLALDPGADLPVDVPRDTVALVDVRARGGAAGGGWIGVSVDGKATAEAALDAPPDRLILRLPLAAGRHLVRAAARMPPGASIAATLSGVLGPADPGAPRLRRLRFEPLGGGPERARLVYDPKEGDEAGAARIFVLVPGGPERRATLLARLGREVAPRSIALEGAAVGGPDGTLYRVRIPLPRGPRPESRLELAVDGVPEAGVAVAALRRSREKAPAELGSSPPPSGPGDAATAAPSPAPPPLAALAGWRSLAAGAGDGEILARIATATAALAAPDLPALERTRARLARGEALLAIDRPRLAAADFSAVLAAAEASAALRHAAVDGLADAYAVSGDPAQALALRHELVEALPDCPPLRERLAWTALAAARPREAAEQFAAVLAVQPDSPEARLGLATALAADFDFAGARRALDEVRLGQGPPAAAPGPLEACAAWLEGLLDLNQGRPAEAFRALARAVRGPGAWQATGRAGHEPADDIEAAAPGPEPVAPADAAAMLAIARRLAPLRAAAADPARPARERIAALVDIALLDSRWALRARAGGFRTVPEADVAAGRRDRAVSAETGRASYLYDASGRGVLLAVEGPTIVRVEARIDRPSAAPAGATLAAEILIEPVTHGAPAARFALEPADPSPSLSFTDRDDLVPGMRQIFDVAIPPGRHVARIRTAGGQAHVRLLALSPGYQDPLGGGDSAVGPRAARAAALRALALSDGERATRTGATADPDADGEDDRLRLEALVLAGRATAVECARLAAGLRARPLGDALDQATLLALAGDRDGAIRAARAAAERPDGDEAALLLALLLASGPPPGEDRPRVDVRLPAVLAGRAALPARVAAKLARAYMAIGKQEDDPAGRWFTRALLLLRDLRAAYPEDAEIAALHEEAISRTTWVEVTGASGTAGFERILAGAPLVSQRAEVADALVAEPRPPERGALITPGRGAAFDVRLASEADLLLEVRAEDLLAAPSATEPVGLAASFDGAPLSRLAAPRGGAAQVLISRVAPGPHRVEVTLSPVQTGRIAKAYLYTSRPAAGTAGVAEKPALSAGGRPFYSLVQRTSIEHRVALAGRPLCLRVRGPLVLRLDARVAIAPGEQPRMVPVSVAISPTPTADPCDAAPPFSFCAGPSPSDAFRDLAGRVPSVAGRLRVALPEERDYEVRIEPAAAGERLLVKAYARVDAARGATRTADAAAEVPPPGPAGAGAGGAAPPPSPAVTGLEPRRPLFGEEDGTLEAFTRGGAFRRRGAEPDDRARQTYAEVGIAHRKYVEPAALWLRHEASVKFPDGGNPVIRAEGRALWRTPLLGIRWLNRAEGNLQWIAWEPEASLDLESRLDRLVPLVAGDLDLYVAAGFRAKEQTLHDYPKRTPRDRTYFDVFSPFYEHDDHWLYARGILTWRPFLDLEIFGSIGANTNRSLSPGDLDRWYWRAGIRGVEGPVAWELAYSWLRRLADRDRAHENDESYVSAALDAWLWTSSSTAVGLFVEGRDYPATGEIGAFVGVRVLFSRGRVFRDFAPGEVLFDEDRGYLFPEPASGRRP